MVAIGPRAPGSDSRLRRGADVRRVIRQGRRVPGRRMVLYVLPGEGQVRAGFVSGRRVGGAVVRNRARRRMKEAWRALSLPTAGGFDVVFVARPDIRRSTFPEVLSDMRGVLAGAGMTAP